MFKKYILSYCICVLVILPLCPNAYSAGRTTDRSIKIIKLSLSPAAEPIPALSYRLLPSCLDQKTGNAALLYSSAVDLCPEGDSEDIHEKINDWRDLPVDQLDRKEVEETLSTFSNCFRQIKLATQRNNCQWEMPVEEGFFMLMPHLSGFRKIAMAMELQIKLYIADGEIDQAMEMLQEGFYMGRNIAEGPTIVQGLVGIAIEAVMLSEIENLIQAPDSPNMYWALTSLPDPLIDLHSSLQYEREVLFIEFPGLRDLESHVLTPAQALKIISDFINKIQSMNSDLNDQPLMNLLPVGWVMIHYSDAKKFLAGKGYSQERIEAMPAAQAVLIYQKQQYLEFSDNMYKWFEIPYYQAQPYLQNSEQQLSSLSNQGIKTNLFTILMPALYRVAFLQARLDRNIAMLRTIEAIRIFAAEHSGQIPESLDEITSVTIPIDPVTGKAFIYSRIDKLNARLEAPVSPAESTDRPVYELTIKP